MLKTKPWTGGTDEEYETQHFSFGEQRLQIAVRQMIEQKVTNGVRDMEAGLQEALDLNDTDKVTLTRFCDKLIRLYCDRAGPSLEEIDREFERILRVPANVVLPEDEVQAVETKDEQYEQLKLEVASLRKQVQRGALMEAKLTAEEEEISLIENVCEVAKKDMELLDLLARNMDSKDTENLVNEAKVLCADTPFMKDEEFEVIVRECDL